MKARDYIYYKSSFIHPFKHKLIEHAMFYVLENKVGVCLCT